MEAPDTFEDLEALWRAWKATAAPSPAGLLTPSMFLSWIDMPSPDVGQGWEECARRAVWRWLNRLDSDPIYITIAELQALRHEARLKYEAWREEVKRERTTDIR